MKEVNEVSGKSHDSDETNLPPLAPAGHDQVAASTTRWDGGSPDRPPHAPPDKDVA